MEMDSERHKGLDTARADSLVIGNGIRLLVPSRAACIDQKPWPCAAGNTFCSVKEPGYSAEGISKTMDGYFNNKLIMPAGE
jgi:hypothetical protein